MTGASSGSEKPAEPSGFCGPALFASKAILLRVGAQFKWADRSGVVLYAIGGPLWAALNPHVDRSDLLANGGRWSIEDSEGDLDL